MKKLQLETDVLIAGAGVAGLRAACAAGEKGLRVLVLQKGACASGEIMGFNAAVGQEDSADCYESDLLAAGCGISDPSLSRALARGAAEEVAFLEAHGLALDREEDGRLHVRGTLGCSHPRLVHLRSLTGGAEMQVLRAYAESLGVRFEKGVALTDIIKQDGVVTGALGLLPAEGTVCVIAARAVILATGGCGTLHAVSTYPADCAGDGAGIALRAGAELIDMEFQQFEPCSFVFPEALRGKIVPTTLLRAGAALRNGEGREFMSDYGLSRENARKGPLSRAMAAEIRAGRGTPHGGVYYDMTMLPEEMIVVGHSIFYKPALAAGLDITREPAEMAPASHTFIGGVRIDEHGATGVPGLFAAGEVTGGVHGADRIGGCAGAEVLVFGRRAGEAAGDYALRTKTGAPAAGEALERLERAGEGAPADIPAVRARLVAAMDAGVGILRKESGLREALETVTALGESFALTGAGGGANLAAYLSTEDMLRFAQAQIRASLLRRESRGVFNRLDYPDRNEAEYRKSFAFSLKDGQMTHREIPR